MKILKYFLILFIGGVISYVFTTYTKSVEDIQATSSMVLSNINYTFNVVEELKRKNNFDREVQEEINNQLLNNVFLLSALNPKVTGFTAAPSIGFCKLIKYYEKDELKVGVIEVAYNIAEHYLERSKSKVLEDINQTQKSLGGNDCNIGGAGGKCPFKDETMCKEHNNAFNSDANKDSRPLT